MAHFWHSSKQPKRRDAILPGQAPKFFNPFRLFNGVHVPDVLLRFPGLSPGAKLCYARLVRYAGDKGYCWPSQKELAAEIGMSDRQVRNYLAELISFDFIRVRQRGLRRSNIYQFVLHAIFEPDRKDLSAQDRKPPSVLERNTRSGPSGRESSSRESVRRESVLAVVAKQDKSQQAPRDNGVSAEGTRRYASERDELIALIADATGELPDAKLVRQIAEMLELRRVPLRCYLDDIKPRILRLAERAGPGFFYKHAKRFATESAKTAEPSPLVEHPKGCTGRTPDGYCRCELGQELKRVEQRPARIAATPSSSADQGSEKHG